MSTVSQKGSEIIIHVLTMSSVCNSEEIGACDVIGVCVASDATVVAENGGTGGLESGHDPAACD